MRGGSPPIVRLLVIESSFSHLRMFDQTRGGGNDFKKWAWPDNINICIDEI